jgi:hypothetical protein
MFSIELLKQRLKVQKDCEKLQALVDNEMEDSTYRLCSNSNYVHITDNILRKSKRIREEDIADKDTIR